MPESCVRVARGLLLFGSRLETDGDMDKRQFLRKVGVKDTTFRSAAERIGAKEHDPGLRFFDCSDGRIAFGPGAGVVLGVSIGSGSLRAGLVDANGVLMHPHESLVVPGQLREKPDVLLGRLNDAADDVLSRARDDESLLVDGALPFLGVSVAWPAAIDRQGRPVGRALAHPGWRGGQDLRQLVARRLSVNPERSHALNDANAAALGVTFDRTRRREHQQQRYPEVTLVLRLAGGIGGATVIIEPPEVDESWGATSGFLESVLIGGANLLAGELGHVTVSTDVIARLNKRRCPKLEPLAPAPCSCVEDPDGEHVHHLEAYTSVGALAKRVDADRAISEVLASVIADPDRAEHDRALTDIGYLVGEVLVGPVAWLNPVTIVLTGALAVPTVERAIDERLADAHPIVSHPRVCSLGSDNAFIRVRGAAMAVHREHVHRELSSLLAGPKKTLARRVSEATEALRPR